MRIMKFKKKKKKAEPKTRLGESWGSDPGMMMSPAPPGNSRVQTAKNRVTTHPTAGLRGHSACGNIHINIVIYRHQIESH